MSKKRSNEAPAKDSPQQIIYNLFQAVLDDNETQAEKEENPHADLGLQDLDEVENAKALTDAIDKAKELELLDTKVDEKTKKQLLSTFENINVQIGDSALDLAARAGNDDAVLNLYNQGASVAHYDPAIAELGNLPLHNAVQQDNLTLATILVAAGRKRGRFGNNREKLDIDQQDPEGFTPLHYAASEGKEKLVELLTLNGADVSGKILAQALSRGHIRTAKHLIRRAVEVYKETADGLGGLSPKEILEKAAPSLGIDAIMNHYQNVHGSINKLKEALTRNDIEYLTLRSSQKPNLLKRRIDTNRGMSLIHFAAKQDDPTMIGFLLKNNAAIFSFDKSKNTPLHWAAHHGRVTNIACIVDNIRTHYKGKNVVEDVVKRVMNSPNARNITALHRATQHNQLEAMKAILTYGADVDAFTNKNKTPLDYALDNRNVEATKLLLEHGATIRNDYKRLIKLAHPVHNAARKGNLELLTLMLAMGGMDINARDDKGKTPLQTAAAYGHVNTTAFLMEHGATIGQQAITSITTLGEYPVHQAIRFNRVDLASYQLAYSKGIEGKNPEKIETAEKRDAQALGKNLLTVLGEDKMNEPNEDGHMPLHIAAWYGRAFAVLALINRKAHIEAKDNEKNRPLHFAALGVHPEIAIFLIKKGASVTKANTVGLTPLHFAIWGDPTKKTKKAGDDKDPNPQDASTPIEERRLAFIALLIEHGASPNIINKIDGSTLLHWATEHNHINLLKSILKDKKCPDINAQNTDGNSALHLASLYGREEAAALLITYGAADSRNNLRQTPIACAFSKLPSSESSSSIAPQEKVINLLLAAGSSLPEGRKLPWRNLKESDFTKDTRCLKISDPQTHIDALNKPEVMYNITAKTTKRASLELNELTQALRIAIKKALVGGFQKLIKETLGIDDCPLSPAQHTAFEKATTEIQERATNPGKHVKQVLGQQMPSSSSSPSLPKR